MHRKRADSFKIAFETVKAELRTGVHAPGARLTANEIAERLDLSQTPVREALSRLAGEGLLQDRRGQGYFVPELSEHDVAMLFRLQREVLRLAAQGEGYALASADIERILAPEADGKAEHRHVIAGERLLRAFAAGASPSLARHLARSHDQLARARMAEPQVLPDLAEELGRMCAAVADGRADVVGEVFDTYFARRIEAAPALARLQVASANIESI